MSDKFDKTPARGWVLYDAECTFCISMAARTKVAVEAAGFRFEPLQSPWVRERLALPEAQLLAEMRVLTIDGRLMGGADALVYLARELSPGHRTWWSRLLILASKVPLGMRVLRFAYQWVAQRRNCRQGACRIPTPRTHKEETL